MKSLRPFSASLTGASALIVVLSPQASPAAEVGAVQVPAVPIAEQPAQAAPSGYVVPTISPTAETTRVPEFSSQSPTRSTAQVTSPPVRTPPLPPQPAPRSTPATPAGKPNAVVVPVQPEPATPAQPAAPEPRVVVSEVVVTGVEGELRQLVYTNIATQPGQAVTRSQLQADINAIGNTGYFANVQATSEDTPLGVRVTFAVEPNPVLRSVQVQNTQVLPQSVIDASFKNQYGSILNRKQLQAGIANLQKWYKDNGYVVAQLVSEPQITPDGRVTLDIAEGVVESVKVKYINADGADKDANGNPIKGRTRDFVITREVQIKPGDVFNQKQAQTDLQRVYNLGIFDDVKLSLEPGQDPRKAIVVVNVAERKNFSLSPSGGYSSSTGFFGAGSFQAGNLGGNNQKLDGNVQIAQRGIQFDLGFTDPWIAGDPYRTSYSVDAFKRESISTVFDGGKDEVNLANGETPRIDRLGGSLTFTRPLTKNVFERPDWVASAGVQYQRVSIRDRDGNISPQDARGNDLSFSGTGKDDLLTASLGLVRDKRNDPLRPTTGSLLRLSTEQSVPVGEGNILFNRLKGNYSFYLPTKLTKFTSGCRKTDAASSDCPQAFAFNLQGGTVIGDLPPYEAFALGGANSVRGYGEGDLGSARSYLQASAEYRFPIVPIVGGALFIDAATDLGSGSSVPGNPAGVREKPGSGVTYGLGVRIQSPLGPVRVDYGWTGDGDNRLQFGIGERF